jgi:hypothetical protein
MAKNTFLRLSLKPLGFLFYGGQIYIRTYGSAELQENIGNDSRDGILGHELKSQDSSLLLHAIHSRILKKTILFSGFKNTYKKVRKLESLHE